MNVQIQILISRFNVLNRKLYVSLNSQKEDLVPKPTIKNTEKILWLKDKDLKAFIFIKSTILLPFYYLINLTHDISYGFN